MEASHSGKCFILDPVDLLINSSGSATAGVVLIGAAYSLVHRARPVQPYRRVRFARWDNIPEVVAALADEEDEDVPIDERALEWYID